LQRRRAIIGNEYATYGSGCFHWDARKMGNAVELGESKSHTDASSYLPILPHFRILHDCFSKSRSGLDSHHAFNRTCACRMRFIAGAAWDACRLQLIGVLLIVPAMLSLDERATPQWAKSTEDRASLIADRHRTVADAQVAIP
jgi:hypothetical protein